MDDDTSIALNFQKQFKSKKKTDLTSKSVIKKYYSNMLARVKTKSYKKKGIQVEISFEEFETFWNSNLSLILKIQNSGLKVSIDRINSFKNYSLDNIRILPNHLNCALGKLEMLQGEMKRIYKILEDGKEWLR